MNLPKATNVKSIPKTSEYLHFATISRCWIRFLYIPRDVRMLLKVIKSPNDVSTEKIALNINADEWAGRFVYQIKTSCMGG